MYTTGANNTQVDQTTTSYFHTTLAQCGSDRLLQDPALGSYRKPILKSSKFHLRSSPPPYESMSNLCTSLASLRFPGNRSRRSRSGSSSSSQQTEHDKQKCRNQKKSRLLRAFKKGTDGSMEGRGRRRIFPNLAEVLFFIRAPYDRYLAREEAAPSPSIDFDKIKPQIIAGSLICPTKFSRMVHEKFGPGNYKLQVRTPNQACGYVLQVNNA